MSNLVSIANDIAKHLSQDALIDNPLEVSAYGSDFWGQRGTPGLVVRPAHVQDIVTTLQYAARYSIPVIPRAAGTNIGAGFLPTQTSILLDMRRLNHILNINLEQNEATVEPGVLNGDLQTRLASLGVRYAPDPASMAISTIGGNIAENAGGPRCLKYGVTYHHVLGVNCVLASGDVRQLNAADTGPDLLGLLIGSEGTLGIIAKARLKLSVLPQVTQTLFASFDHPEKVGDIVSAILAMGIVPATIEYLDQQAIRLFESYAPTGYPLDAVALIIDVDGNLTEVEHDMSIIERIVRKTAREVQIARSEATRALLWRGRLLAGQALAASKQQYHICDTTVPRSRISDMQFVVQQVAARYNLTMLMMGHAGDGNIHPVILFDGTDNKAVDNANRAATDITTAALAIGGTITGEHGIGSEKISFMYSRFSATEIAAMRAVKYAFDPTGILNPGILLPEPISAEPPLPYFAAALKTVMLGYRNNRNRDLSGSSQIRMVSTQEPENTNIEIDPENLTVRVQASVILQNLQDKLWDTGYYCQGLQNIQNEEHKISIEALLSQQHHRLAVRDTLLEVEVTLEDNLSACFGSSVVKDVAGYDMKRLFIGSKSLFGELKMARFRIRHR